MVELTGNIYNSLKSGKKNANHDSTTDILNMETKGRGVNIKR